MGFGNRLHCFQVAPPATMTGIPGGRPESSNASWRGSYWATPVMFRGGTGNGKVSPRFASRGRLKVALDSPRKTNAAETSRPRRASAPAVGA